MYYVYILKSLLRNIFYKGITDNLERRLHQHLNNQCITTKNMFPWKLVFVQICKNRYEARALEKYLKSGSGREIIKQLY